VFSQTEAKGEIFIDGTSVVSLNSDSKSDKDTSISLRYDSLFVSYQAFIVELRFLIFLDVKYFQKMEI